MKTSAIFGGKCQFCNTDKRQLKLAHKAYLVDSVLPHGGYRARIREATAHPERFYLLCTRCHVAYDAVKEITGKDILDWRLLP